MKINYVIILLLISYSNVFSQWVEINSNTTNSLRSICFVNDSTGFYSGFYGTISKTNNSGANTLLTSGTTNNLFCMYFIDSLNGYTAGWNNTILKTNDAGLNWSQCSNGISQHVFSLYFLNIDTGYAIGYGARIFKTINAGNSWQTLASGYTWPYTLNSICFINDSVGFAVGLHFTSPNNGFIIKTTNAGASWSLCSQTNYPDLYNVYFLNANLGFAVGKNGTIIKTTNEGSSWVFLNTGTTNHLKSIYFIDENTGFASGDNGTIIKTIDGGTSWMQQFTGTNKTIFSICFTDLNNGFAVGDSGLFIKTSNSGNSITENIDLSDNFKICPNPAYNYLNIEINDDLKFPLYACIFNSQGLKVKNVILNNFKTKIEITDLLPGFYFLKVVGENYQKGKLFVKNN